MSTLANNQGASHARVLGIGSYRPRRVVPNSEIVDRLDSSDEWIQTRSGIRERRWASDDETIMMMALSSARDAMAAADIDPAQIDCVVVSTISHFLQTPSFAASLAYELGTDGAAAFDISAACAGFCYGISMASDFVRGGSARHVLVVGVERLTDLTDHDDRSSAFIFADGAGAAIVGPSDSPGIGPVVWGSAADETQRHLIEQKQDWLALLADAKEAGVAPERPYLRMEGNPVFRWASFQMAKTAQEALDRAGVTIDQLDCFVPHQANGRIVDAMARAMKLPDTVAIARDIETMGNTSAASIPLALTRMIAEGEAKPGDLALLIAFGAGLVYAAQVVVVP